MRKCKYLDFETLCTKHEECKYKHVFKGNVSCDGTKIYGYCEIKD